MKETVAIFAPTGRDEAVIAQILTAAAIKCGSFSPEVLMAGLGEGGFAAAILTEEALHKLPLAAMQRVLAAQPPWSDFPFLVLVAKGMPSPATTAALAALGNVSQIERPVHPSTLCSAVRSAIRARQRQREAEQYLDARALAEKQLRDLANSLERRVADRTQALADANARLHVEMAERIDAQQRMHVMQAELIHISRVSAMGTMASTLAHELNQPLAAVMNYVAGSRRMLARADLTTPPEILDALDAARANAQRAGDIVRRLRDLVARGEVNRQVEDLPALIDDALKLGMVDAASSGVDCLLRLDPAVTAVLVDRVQIQQVLINLVRNAMEAMQHSPKKLITIASHRLNDDMIEVMVIDSGPGIDPATMALLFSPFNTSKSNGMGIGLSISRTIIEANGGSITGSNGTDGGAIFRFTMPDATSQQNVPGVVARFA